MADSISKKFLNYSLGIIIIWTLIILALAYIDIVMLRQATENLAMREAKAHFQKDEAFRFWSAKHGGFYVFADERTPPSPYLTYISDRDIINDSGVMLTLMNPAYALRQMLEEYEETYGIGGHITSLNPLRPKNKPDEWERAALESFEDGIKEVHEYIDINGEPYLRYMEPLITQQGCLKCHEHQGYEVGDIRGGVSVSLPLESFLMEENKNESTHILSFLILWLLGVFGVVISYFINRKNLIKREYAQAESQKLNVQLEARVEARTKELQHEIIIQKELAETLKISEERYKGIIDSTASCIAVYEAIDDGVDFKFIDFNPMAEKLENLSKKDVIGKKVTEVFPGIEEFGLLKVFRNVFKTGIAEDFPVAFYKDKKTQGHRENNVYKLSTGEIIAVYQDVSERELIKKNLQMERDKLISIFETMVDGIYLIDKDYNLEYVNSALKNEFGSVDNQKCYKYFHELDEPCSFCKNEKVFKGEIVKWEWTSDKNNKTYDLIDSPLYNVDGSISKLEIFRDITDRKAAEKEITQLSTAVTQSPSVILITDLEGNIEYVNSKFVQITGYSLEEVIGKRPSILKSGLLPSDVYNDLWKKVSAGEIWRGEFQNRKKNGELFWESATISAIYDNDGKITNYLKVAEDITEHKRALDKAEESEKKYHRLINATSEGFWLLDTDMKTIDVNSALCDMISYSKEEIIGKSPYDFVDKASQKIFDFQFPQSQKTKHRVYDISLLSKDGRLVPTLFNATTIIDEKGNYKGSFAFISDISERKRDEQIQKVLFQISNAVAVSVDVEDLIKQIKDVLGTIIDTTNFYVALYNPETDMLSMPYYADKYDKYTTVSAAKTLSKYVIQTKKPLLANLKVKKKLHKEGILEFQGSLSKVWLGVPLKIGTKVIGVFAVQSYEDENAFNMADMKMLEFVSDQISISIQRKQKEEDLLVALNKANESDRVKSTFLATMSHELRTPLNAIIGFSGLINEDGKKIEMCDFARIINSSGHHLLSIVEDLFDITLIESGETVVEKKEVEIIAVLHEVYRVMKAEQHRLNKDNIELNLIVPENMEEQMIETDVSKFKQILINLLRNAFKFTRKGYIDYGFKFENIKGKSFLKFYVSDTGIGIPKDKHELIFNIFTQLDSSSTRQFEGTGIGLSISQKLSKMLGGEIWLESKEGKGTTFYFTIPNSKLEKLDDATAAENIDKIEDGISLENKTVLVVEDDEASFEFLKIMLERIGLKVMLATDGKKAIKYCQDNKDINLVLMDINMPIMNGYLATKEIKKFRPELKIIAQTAFAIVGDREKALEAGCDDYISKPIDLQELQNLIIKYIN